MKFELVGYKNPTGTYPSWVWAIGMYQNELCAIYKEEDGTYIFNPLGENSEFVRLSREDLELLNDYDYETEVLFELRVGEITSYPILHEKEFYTSLLDQPELFGDVFNKFIAAKITQNELLIRQVLGEVLLFNKKFARNFALQWAHDARKNLAALGFNCDDLFTQYFNLGELNTEYKPRRNIA